LKSVKYLQSYSLNEVCDIYSGVYLYTEVSPGVTLLQLPLQGDDGGNFLFFPFVPLKYISGLQIIESTIKKTKEIFQQPIMVESEIIKQGLLLIIQLVFPILSNFSTQSSLMSIY